MSWTDQSSECELDHDELAHQLHIHGEVMCSGNLYCSYVCLCLCLCLRVYLCSWVCVSSVKFMYGMRGV